jgi:hypothetical protein
VAAEGVIGEVLQNAMLASLIHADRRTLLPVCSSLNILILSMIFVVVDMFNPQNTIV